MPLARAGPKSIVSDDAPTYVNRATRYGVRLVTPFTPKRFEIMKSRSVAPRFQSRCPKSCVCATRTARSGSTWKPSLSAHFPSTWAPKYDDCDR